MPSEAICARWGGEEFLVLLPDCNLDQATQLAQSFIEQTAANQMGHAQSIEVTVSMGLSMKKANQDMDDWIHQADQALYQSKNMGRNQLTVAR
jgi:diguanylate cyclase (GGDEF)-like protein